MIKLHMHTNRIWLVFITILAIVAFGYTCNALFKVYHYSALTRQTLTTHVEWTSHKTWLGRYFLEANYEFSMEGRIYHGRTDFRDETYINAAAAEQQILNNTKQPWKVWYQPQQFTYSSLQKKFPAKECGSAAVLVGLLIYFIFLGFYTGTLYRDGTDHPRK